METKLTYVFIKKKKKVMEHGFYNKGCGELTQRHGSPGNVEPAWVNIFP